MNAHTNIAPINAVMNLTLATPLFFPFLSIITVPTTSTTGNMYANIPKVPNWIAAKNVPALPAKPKLLINRISATASAINKAASVNEALFTFFFFLFLDDERDALVLVPFDAAGFEAAVLCCEAVLRDCVVLFFSDDVFPVEAIVVTPFL